MEAFLMRYLCIHKNIETVRRRKIRYSDEVKQPNG